MTSDVRGVTLFEGRKTGRFSFEDALPLLSFDDAGLRLELLSFSAGVILRLKDVCPEACDFDECIGLRERCFAGLVVVCERSLSGFCIFASGGSLETSFDFTEVARGCFAAIMAGVTKVARGESPPLLGTDLSGLRASSPSLLDRSSLAHSF